MATDLTIVLIDRPGSLAGASDVLGRAGINIEGACGLVCEGDGIFHVLVEDGHAAQRALIDAGFEIRAERQVVATPVDNRPGSAAGILRRIADAKVNVDLIYMTGDGRLVLGSDDPARLRDALEGQPAAAR